MINTSIIYDIKQYIQKKRRGYFDNFTIHTYLEKKKEKKEKRERGSRTSIVDTFIMVLQKS